MYEKYWRFELSSILASVHSYYVKSIEKNIWDESNASKNCIWLDFEFLIFDMRVWEQRFFFSKLVSILEFFFIRQNKNKSERDAQRTVIPWFT